MSWTDARVRLATIVAAAVLVADQATKAIVAAWMIPGKPGSTDLLPFFALTYVRNTGAAFGLLADRPPEIRVPLLLVVTVVAVGALVSFLRRTSPDHRWLVGALGGILGGALGNLICRVFRGEVIDFLDVHWGELHTGRRSTSPTPRSRSGSQSSCCTASVTATRPKRGVGLRKSVAAPARCEGRVACSCGALEPGERRAVVQGRVWAPMVVVAQPRLECTTT
jgi:signal peptidase II